MYEQQLQTIELFLRLSDEWERLRSIQHEHILAADHWGTEHYDTITDDQYRALRDGSRQKPLRVHLPIPGTLANADVNRELAQVQSLAERMQQLEKEMSPLLTFLAVEGQCRHRLTEKDVRSFILFDDKWIGASDARHAAKRLRVALLAETRRESPAGYAVQATGQTATDNVAERAWRAKEAACEVNPNLVGKPDKEIYEYLTLHPVEGYELPAQDSFCRYLRTARDRRGEGKNASRRGRSGRSTMRSRDVQRRDSDD